MRVRVILIAAGLLGAFALVAVAQGTRVFINGKPATRPPIVQNGQTYVTVSDLKAAGAQVTVTAGQIAIRFRPDAGGAYQIAGVEGTLGEWLFNGIWRMRVGTVAPIEQPFSSGTPGWGVTVEIRNGAEKEVSMFNTGVQVPTLALANGTVLKADEGDWQQVHFRSMLPGASVTHQVKFFFPPGTTRSQAKPAVRLIIPIDVKFGLLRDTGMNYSVGAPAFRVTL